MINTSTVKNDTVNLRRYLTHNNSHLLDQLITGVTKTVDKDSQKKSLNVQTFTTLNRAIRVQKHPYHLMPPNGAPITVAITAGLIANFVANRFHGHSLVLDYAVASYEFYTIPPYTFKLIWYHFVDFGPLIGFILAIYWWFEDIIIESTIERQHTQKVRVGLRIGMLLFIVSEIFFFISFFWAFFHSALTPAVSIGAIWPPKGIHALNPFGLPILNTVILLSSGVSITLAHRCILANKRIGALHSLNFTILLGLVFTACQAVEYVGAPFSINDSIYGSIFFVATGFHGVHVLIGTMFLCVCLGRLYLGHFTSKIHIGFEAAAWYWHFVDVVWIFLFVSIYWWGRR